VARDGDRRALSFLPVATEVPGKFSGSDGAHD
jgi:hypothetical protein